MSRNRWAKIRILVLLVLACGCKRANPLVGSWSGSQGIDYKFDDSGHFTRYVFASGSAAVFTGDYKLAGDQLTLSITKATSPDPGTQQAADIVARANPVMKLRLIQVSRDVIQFQNRLGLTTFKRQ